MMLRRFPKTGDLLPKYRRQWRNSQGKHRRGGL
jgi:hypothetical protein